MASNIDWKTILSQLVAQVVPILIKMIIEWLTGATDEEAVAVGKRFGKAVKAAQSEMA